MQRAIRAELVIVQAASTTSGELMLSFRAWIGLGLICLGLVSCATMSPKECRVADWHEIGLTDGLAGKALTFFNERRLDCEEAGVVANPNAYLAGREQGRIRDEQRSILNALQWNQHQSRNAAALLEQLR